MNQELDVRSHVYLMNHDASVLCRGCSCHATEALPEDELCSLVLLLLEDIHVVYAHVMPCVLSGAHGYLLLSIRILRLDLQNTITVEGEYRG